MVKFTIKKAEFEYTWLNMLKTLMLYRGSLENNLLPEKSSISLSSFSE